jgi:hypothetical protein
MILQHNDELSICSNPRSHNTIAVFGSPELFVRSKSVDKHKKYCRVCALHKLGSNKLLGRSASTGISLKQEVNTLRFPASIRVPKENHPYFWLHTG